MPFAIALSGLNAASSDLNVTANNIANANTTGYNSEHILFNSYLVKDVNERAQNPMAFAQVLPKRGPYQRPPIAKLATTATRMASQLT